MMYRRSHYRVDHHQKLGYLIRSCYMKYTIKFESYQMYRKNELLQDFVHCLIECEKKADVLLDNMESNDFNVIEMSVCLVSQVNTCLP